MENLQESELNNNQPIKIKKTADKTKYMREYKQKQYEANPEDIKNKNKLYYYKYKYNISTDDMAKYGGNLPTVINIKKYIEELKQNDPELLKTILNEYLL